MARLRPAPAAHHTFLAKFVHKHLHNYTRLSPSGRNTQGSVAPSQWPYQIFSRTEKTLQLLVRGKPVTVSADRVKPAYVLNEADCGSKLQHLSNILRGGGGDVSNCHRRVYPYFPVFQPPAGASVAPRTRLSGHVVQSQVEFWSWTVRSSHEWFSSRSSCCAVESFGQ
jgi:hypothetical protein